MKRSSVFRVGARAGAMVFALSTCTLSMAQVFSARTVDFSAVTGTIEIRVSATPNIVVQAPPKAGSGFRASVTDSVLKLELTLPASTSRSTRSLGSMVNSAVGPGAVAIQNIPGNSSVQMGDTGLGSVVVQVPVGTLIRATGFVGQAEIKGEARQINVQVGSGDVRIERVVDAKLRVQGAGSIHVEAASGDLELDLPGAGSIEVEKGQVGKLSAALGGAGEIRFGGTATAARLRADGAGSIRVHRVVQKPTIINNAAGEIVVENGG
jgi:hypothetical protein